MLRGIYRKEDVRPFISEAERIVAEYGWEDRVVFLYSFNTKISDLLDRLRMYDRYSKYSKCLLDAEANCLAEILNCWVESRRDSVWITLTENGENCRVGRDIADGLVGRGFATYA